MLSISRQRVKNLTASSSCPRRYRFAWLLPMENVEMNARAITVASVAFRSDGSRSLRVVALSANVGGPCPKDRILCNALQELAVAVHEIMLQVEEHGSSFRGDWHRRWGWAGRLGRRRVAPRSSMKSPDALGEASPPPDAGVWPRTDAGRCACLHGCQRKEQQDAGDGGDVAVAFV